MDRDERGMYSVGKLSSVLEKNICRTVDQTGDHLCSSPVCYRPSYGARPIVKKKYDKMIFQLYFFTGLRSLFKLCQILRLNFAKACGTWAVN